MILVNTSKRTEKLDLQRQSDWNIIIFSAYDLATNVLGWPLYKLRTSRSLCSRQHTNQSISKHQSCKKSIPLKSGGAERRVSQKKLSGIRIITEVEN